MKTIHGLPFKKIEDNYKRKSIKHTLFHFMKIFCHPSLLGKPLFYRGIPNNDCRKGYKINSFFVIFYRDINLQEKRMGAENHVKYGGK